MQEQWEHMETKTIRELCENFHIGPCAARAYVRMTPEEIRKLDSPARHKRRKRIGDAFVNIIYKMMLDGKTDEVIFYYIKQQGITITDNTLWSYIHSISANNFPARPRYYALKQKDLYYPDDVTVIRRNDLLKYLLTVNPKTEKDKTIGMYVEKILQKYPIAAWVMEAFKRFHNILMGDEAERLDEFIAQYSGTKIKSFCDGLKKDIAPVRNAITLEVSSGFVEGNNNKFKLLKRIVYGRSGLVNLEKKCRLAFMSGTDDFRLDSLI